MKQIALASLLFVCVLCVAATKPDFALVRDAADGQLTWLGHTVAPCLDAAVPQDDHIVEDTAAQVLSLGLYWHSTPDVKTGECLAANFYWRIPQSELIAPRYSVSAERAGPDAIVFILSPDRQGAAVLRSPTCRLAKAFVGKLEDIAKSMTPIDAKAMLKALEEEHPSSVAPDQPQPK